MGKSENNRWENDPHDNEKLRELVRDLAHAINSVFAESTEIRTVIKDIEEEGYQVDLVLASITRALNKEHKGKGDIHPPALIENIKFELNRFDQSFLKSIKIKSEADSK